jgi:hypothetical protein
MSNNEGFLAWGILCKAFFSSVGRSACCTEKTQQMLRDNQTTIHHYAADQLLCRDVILETGTCEEVCRTVSVFMNKIYSFNEIKTSGVKCV